VQSERRKVFGDQIPKEKKTADPHEKTEESRSGEGEEIQQVSQGESPVALDPLKNKRVQHCGDKNKGKRGQKREMTTYEGRG